jgi:hypothetical protein
VGLVEGSVGQARYWKYINQRRRIGAEHPFVTQWWKYVNHRIIPHKSTWMAERCPALGKYFIVNGYIYRVNPHRRGLRATLERNRIQWDENRLPRRPGPVSPAFIKKYLDDLD